MNLAHLFLTFTTLRSYPQTHREQCISTQNLCLPLGEEDCQIR